MLLTKEVEVKPTGKMIQYYKDKGYDAKYKQPLMVKVSDLSPKGCYINIEVLCDCCNEVICNPTYRDYYNRIEKFGEYACSNCRYIHQKKTCLDKYGVDSQAKLEDVRKRMANTSLERYGTVNPMQNNRIKDKLKKSVYERYGVYNVSQSVEVQQKREQTFIERYNVTNPFESKEIQQKISNTLLSKYGFEYVSQIPDVQEKVKQTNLQRYGAIYPNQSPKVRAKTTKTLYNNSSQKISKQQQYISNLYNGILNYPVFYYNVDIYLSNDNLVIEYDGGGHNLNVITGRITQEEFKQKEIIRDNIIKREGYKQMRIISSRDLLPSDQALLQMLDEARQYFSQFPNHSWIEYNIDTSTVHNAEHKDGIPYDFGELRKIKQSDVA